MNQPVKYTLAWNPVDKILPELDMVYLDCDIPLRNSTHCAVKLQDETLSIGVYAEIYVDDNDPTKGIEKQWLQYDGLVVFDCPVAYWIALPEKYAI